MPRSNRVASGLAGRIGFAAQEIGGDEVISFNGDETFAMASTYKVAIAATVLDRVDKGRTQSRPTGRRPARHVCRRRSCDCRDIPLPRGPVLGGELDLADDHGE